MLKKIIICVFTVIYLVMGTICFAQAEIPPTPTSSIYVQDYAQVLSAETKQKINALGQSLQNQTKAQIVVVTVKSLEEMPLEDYSLGILRQWGVGNKSMNNGVVMLIAVNDRQSRVEVGYGLEGALPDGRTGQIQDEYLLPYFKDGDYDSGILNGYLALTKIVGEEYKVALAGAVEPVKAKQVVKETGFFDDLQNIIIGVGIVLLIILDFTLFGGRITMLVISMLGRRGGGGGFGGGSGGGGGSSRRW